MSQVLDEIGVDLDSMVSSTRATASSVRSVCTALGCLPLSSQMADAPSRRVATAAPEAKDTAPSDAEVEAMMRSLGVAS